MISRKALLEFSRKHPDAAEPLDNWYRRALKARWENLADVRLDYPHADPVGDCTVFNIAGNKYRLITRIKYEYRIVYIRFVLTHPEYSRGGWKSDC
ncbi:MAG TPA: type II toxin-antitoxin system HigB family toxin [Blastocatellia bacterium]